jgi:hypothetical protein
MRLMSRLLMLHMRWCASNLCCLFLHNGVEPVVGRVSRVALHLVLRNAEEHLALLGHEGSS